MAAITWAVVIAAFGMLVIALLVSWYVHHEAGRLLAVDRAGVALDVLKVSGAVVAGLGAAVALTVSYRKQKEEENRRDGERFEQASRQLGDADPAVRIAGVYALARVANESDDYRRSIVQMLCAYLRLNRRDDTTVQQTICEVLSVSLGSEHSSGGVGPGHWSGQPIDLHGVIFEEEVDFSNCYFAARTRFDGAIFKRSATFINARFGSQSVFNGAEFNDLAYFFFADFLGAALFNHATFASMTAFNGAKFRHGLQANGATFAQGVGFTKAVFPNGATFSAAEMGAADFEGTLFERGTGSDQSDAVYRGAAYFRGTRFEYANFDHARFQASVHFDSAIFQGASFDGTTFADEVTVSEADFGESPDKPAAQPAAAEPSASE